MGREIADELRSRLHVALNRPVARRFDDYTIEFPPNSRIVEYQRTNPRYDQFLPHLACYLPPGAGVVDVGANVGDTLAAMAMKSDGLAYLCIEADEGFFAQLVKNIRAIEAARPRIEVLAVKALVGESVSGAVLKGDRGTKNAVIGEGGGLVSRSLDQIIAELEKPFSVRLLKSDVDGFDYDVLGSSLEVMNRDNPLVFFECQIDNETHRAGYAKVLRQMETIGYSEWTLFDNFGEVVLRTGDLGTIQQLLDYVWAQSCGRSTRTIYYFDILAAQPQDHSLIDRVIADFI